LTVIYGYLLSIVVLTCTLLFGHQASMSICKRKHKHYNNIVSTATSLQFYSTYYAV